MRKLVIKIIAFLFSASAASSQNSKPLWSNAAFTLYPNKVVQGEYTATAISANELSSNFRSAAKLTTQKEDKLTAVEWKLLKNISAFPQYKSSYPISDVLYNLAIAEMITAVEPDSTFRTGKQWSGVWTRDISYSIILSMAYLQPQVAMKSLLRKTNKNGRIIQDTGTGGAWPNSTDRMIWATAAWEIYEATGDEKWLKQAFAIIKNSLEDDYNVDYDKVTGLVKGESSFLDWREQTYPKWMQPADIYESECLGTNAVHYQANKVLSNMAKILNDNDGVEKYKQIAEKIKNSLNKYLWMPEKGYYAQYLYGRNSKIVSPRSESLGEALCVVFGIAGIEKQKQIIRNTPIMRFGIPCIYPQIPNIPPYHNDAVWPFVQSYFALAAAKAGNEEAVMESIAAVYRPEAMFATNKENFVASTGDFAGTQINSSNMLWSLSGSIALIHKIIFGIHFTENRLSFQPFVPAALAGKRSLINFTYKNSVLDIDLEGYGNKIKSFAIDGKKSKPEISRSLNGRHRIKIILSNNNVSKSGINIVEHYVSPEVPKMDYKDDTLKWNTVVGVVQYQILKNGKEVTRTNKTILPVTNEDYGEYQVVAIDSMSVPSFASEPLIVVPDKLITNVEIEKYIPKGSQVYKGYSGDGFVEVSKTINTNISIPINIGEDGVYTIDFKYANGNGPVNTENKSAIRTLKADDKRIGTIVLPQRGKDEWSNWGWSNSLLLNFTKGNHTLSLSLEPSDENMNGEINQAMLDYIRIVRIK